MKSRDALRVLAEVSEPQWGLVTSAQASARGVSHMNLTRLSESGDLVRVSHGVYRDAGAPDPRHEALRAAWLATEPKRLADDRLRDQPPSAVVSGESAARLHGIGDLRAMRSEFTTPTRRQSQRPDVRYRTRQLPSSDVTVRDGLPVTTVERTIADLVEERQGLSIVAHALRDAAMQTRLDTTRLTALLSPLAERNGHPRGDGAALLADLLRIEGIDAGNLAGRLGRIPEIGARITASQLQQLSDLDLDAFDDSATSELVATLRPIFEKLSDLSVELRRALEAVREAGDAGTPAIVKADRVAELLEAADWARLAEATRQTISTVSPCQPGEMLC
ncbi:type IV toxin-antitoxin system AbiEi family antitoxin domain-containing protein [Tessaracoccus lacteus]|uniref:Type IV toxin-antitoxin system AbiEi family antitoxin domain-containing protein n=1 Tax=Tessaracoccus lacteus TaxID=3041766 RepID=A0ABY8PXR7_9ACTN|nr:type IV toxin-antitoxin system AbiEi family antitoxin domain-containing protein [Tessaracoccus sp. T21]WGT47264.1 type IV toxin-antitoxin system AbiEi family antitoxin domain-containing protein [Tessaracoccus sp. T21]